MLDEDQWEFLVFWALMAPIVICSVVALATFFERMWSLSRARVIPPSFVVELNDLIRQERWNDALTLCRKRDLAVARVMMVVLEARDQPREVIKERAEEIGRREAAELERYTPILGTIASIAPLLGILGTVTGMILVFAIISDRGVAVRDLAAGISTALWTTAAGLSVGIPALVANRFLLGRVDSLVLELEEEAQEVVNLLSQRGSGEEAAK